MQVEELNDIFKRMKDADAVNRMRGIRNTMATANIQGSMFNSEEIDELVRGGSNVDGFNLFAKHLRGVAGSFLSNWYDPKFSSASDDGVSPDTLKMLEEVYLSDKDLNGYKSSSRQCIWDGLTYRGVEEIVINRPVLSDPRTWNIGFRPVRAETIIFDPANNENSISRNSENCVKFSYYSQNKIEKMYPHKRDAIREADARMVMGDFDDTGDIYNAILDGDKRSRNNQWQVVEYYHIENEKTKQRVYVPTWTPIPDFGFKIDSPEDRVSLMAWGVENGLSTKEENIVEVEEIIPVLYVEIWIPELNVILDSGKDERQLGGHLPFYAWSYMEIMGTSIGLVDSLWSSVKDFNAREKQKTKWLEKTPVDKTVLHPNLYGNNSEKGRKIIEEFSDGSKPIIADADLPVGVMQHYIYQTRGGSIPAAISHDETFKLSLMNEISGLTPAMQGLTERTGESGNLFARKVIEGSIQQKLPQESLAQHEHDKAGDWLKLVPFVYGGAANYNRKFRKAGTRDFVMANEFLGYREDGSAIVKNDLSIIERVEVTIGKSNESDFSKQMAREYDLEMLKVIRLSQTNSEMIAVIENNLARNMSFTSDDEKRRMEDAIKRREELEKIQAEARIEGMDAKIAEANMQEGQAVQAESLLPQDTQLKMEQMAVASKNNKMQSMQLDQAMNQLAQPQQPQMAQGNAEQATAQPQPSMA